jgi:hypothetical protein
VLRLSGEDWRLLAEASLLLMLASAAIALVPFRRLPDLLGSKTAGPKGESCDSGQLRRLCWAVEASARWLPWRTVCFQKGVALHWMFRRRGLASRLHYGVGRLEENALGAHVWVSHGGSIVMGGEVASKFACLATFPAKCAEGAE